ncbi:aminoglycoside phosphotransferase [Micromonospora marina]|uniref:Phosphotransferase enzyme family n=1 Tax=Micromonospora marina TaxID=307120 RepID=A0A1C4ZNK5_9ACTN|nr:aminoglycoside phosphotransferase [Micromonospora marina]SCF34515.1 Phosphotransferase enzyme family [Micromonospora marina]
MRSEWSALPKGVRTEIAERVGGVVAVNPAPTGNHAEIASTVVGSSGKVFVKAASNGLGVQTLRYELVATRAVNWFPPAVLWHFECNGWFVVGVEHLDGPHPDLAPGSPDLDLLQAALKALQDTPAPTGTWFTPAGRLGLALPEMEGGALVHSDMNPTNLILTSGGLRIVDWAWMTKAAAWVELALLAPWLIGSGHSPAQAEEWLGQFPAWSSVRSMVLDSFAAVNAAKWKAKAEQNNDGWIHDLAAWMGQWADHRSRP